MALVLKFAESCMLDRNVFILFLSLLYQNRSPYDNASSLESLEKVLATNSGASELGPIKLYNKKISHR